MKTKELKRKPPTRSRAKSRFSTSNARANFAKALETAHLEKTVIGFDRYGQPVAALVPIDAIRMLAGHGGDVDPQVRDKIMRMSRLFLMDIPAARPPRRPAAPKARAKKKTVRPRAKTKRPSGAKR